MRTRASIVFILLLLFLAVIAQNTEVVTVRVLFWTVQMSRILLLGIALMVGVVIGFLLGRPWKRRKKPTAPASKTQASERQVRP